MELKKDFIEYMESYPLGYDFQDLYDLVIGTNNCIFCGACVSICPRIGMGETKPTLLEYDPECSMCFKYCARTYFPKKVFFSEIFPEKIYQDPLLGYHQKFVAAKATDDKILEKAQNGGIVTSLLIQALELGIIDGVLLTDKDENWIPKPIIARTNEEILAAAGSKYTMSPSLLPYYDAVFNHKLEKLAFVGMPCQIHTVRKLQMCPPLSDKYGKFSLIIGLYCSSNFSSNLIKGFINEGLKIPNEAIIKIDISKGKLFVYMKDGQVEKVPVRDIKDYSWSSCKFCRDYTAEFADISIGSVGALANDWSSVIIRTNIGKKIFEVSEKNGKLISTDKYDLSMIKKQCLRKKSQATEIDSKVLELMNFINLSEFEAKAYTTLVSLGYADLVLLTKAMKSENLDILNALNKLQERKWIFKNQKIYRPVNPTDIIKNELNNAKLETDSDNRNLKLNTLNKLETLFMQKNPNDVRYTEFVDLFIDIHKEK